MSHTKRVLLFVVLLMLSPILFGVLESRAGIVPACTVTGAIVIGAGIYASVGAPTSADGGKGAGGREVSDRPRRGGSANGGTPPASGEAEDEAGSRESRRRRT